MSANDDVNNRTNFLIQNISRPESELIDTKAPSVTVDGKNSYNATEAISESTSNNSNAKERKPEGNNAQRQQQDSTYVREDIEPPPASLVGQPTSDSNDVQRRCEEINTGRRSDLAGEPLNNKKGND